jgi:V/A-type H+/Na+-transporting ATPase subunit D
MAKIKLTKGELKLQRDSLRQYERYLPTLQLKKQQLQLEILQQIALLEEKERRLSAKKESAKNWAVLLNEPGIDGSTASFDKLRTSPERSRGALAIDPERSRRIDLKPYLKVESIESSVKNVAGVDFAVFSRAEFTPAEYDLFLMPLWIDSAIEQLRVLVALQEEIRTLEKGIEMLRHELRITTQRVNLFEKVKIPEAVEAIRLIKVFLGDQMANAVGRSKIAKQKIEELAKLFLVA